MPLPQINALLEAYAGPEPPFPPTDLFQEKWLIRLVLDWFADHDLAHHLQFARRARWFSEAYLPSALRIPKKAFGSAIPHRAMVHDRPGLRLTSAEIEDGEKSGLFGPSKCGPEGVWCGGIHQIFKNILLRPCQLGLRTLPPNCGLNTAPA
jgi:hypothetical protein